MIPSCPQDITYTNAVVAPAAFINNNGGIGSTVSWVTTDKLDINTYTITIFATNYCVSD